MPRFTATLFAVLFALLLVSSGKAQSSSAMAVPNLINFSGRLPEAAGGAILCRTHRQGGRNGVLVTLGAGSAFSLPLFFCLLLAFEYFRLGNGNDLAHGLGEFSECLCLGNWFHRGMIARPS